MVKYNTIYFQKMLKTYVTVYLITFIVRTDEYEVVKNKKNSWTLVPCLYTNRILWKTKKNI